MASIRMPITGHSAPNGSATTFENNLIYKYSTYVIIVQVCIYKFFQQQEESRERQQAFSVHGASSTNFLHF